MRELTDLASRAEYLEAVIRDINHPHWLSAVKYVTDRGYGPVPKPVEISGRDGEPLTIRVVRES
jgi:hypothetical protein